jgi:hypothetical protein
VSVAFSGPVYFLEYMEYNGKPNYAQEAIATFALDPSNPVVAGNLGAAIAT